jgi:hypothetical protein
VPALRLIAAVARGMAASISRGSVGPAPGLDYAGIRFS